MWHFVTLGASLLIIRFVIWDESAVRFVGIVSHLLTCFVDQILEIIIMARGPSCAIEIFSHYGIGTHRVFGGIRDLATLAPVPNTEFMQHFAFCAWPGRVTVSVHQVNPLCMPSNEECSGSPTGNPQFSQFLA